MEFRKGEELAGFRCVAAQGPFDEDGFVGFEGGDDGGVVQGGFDADDYEVNVGIVGNI